MSDFIWALQQKMAASTVPVACGAPRSRHDNQLLAQRRHRRHRAPAIPHEEHEKYEPHGATKSRGNSRLKTAVADAADQDVEMNTIVSPVVLTSAKGKLDADIEEGAIVDKMEEADDIGPHSPLSRTS